VHVHTAKKALKTERVTLLTTKDFRSFLRDEALREGVSMAELVRQRCERKPGQEEAVLSELTSKLREALAEAHCSLREGLHEAHSALAEIRSGRVK
jgi:hypothetical protein